MNKHYYLQYFDSISNGLKNTLYFKDAKSLEGKIFFQEVGALMKKLKQSKGKIFFFGNGASAAFANHMALDFSKR